MRVLPRRVRRYVQELHPPFRRDDLGVQGQHQRAVRHTRVVGLDAAGRALGAVGRRAPDGVLRVGPHQHALPFGVHLGVQQAERFENRTQLAHVVRLLLAPARVFGADARRDVPRVVRAEVHAQRGELLGFGAARALHPPVAAVGVHRVVRDEARRRRKGPGGRGGGGPGALAGPAARRGGRRFSGDGRWRLRLAAAAGWPTPSVLDERLGLGARRELFEDRARRALDLRLARGPGEVDAGDAAAVDGVEGGGLGFGHWGQ